MSIKDLLQQLQTSPEKIEFADVMSTIDDAFVFSATAFKNGDAHNAAGTNNGSCKLFAFAKLQQLDQASTLALFGDYYRIDVLNNPGGDDHANIRNFMQFGWDGITFEGQALSAK